MVKGSKQSHERTSVAARISARRAQVADLYLRRFTQTQIAKQFGVNISQISRDLKYIIAQWRKEAVADIAEVVARELAELDQMERDCCLEFASNRDDVWVYRRLQVKDRRAKLLGLDQPAKADLTSGGSPLKITELIVERAYPREDETEASP